LGIKDLKVTRLSDVTVKSTWGMTGRVPGDARMCWHYHANGKRISDGHEYVTQRDPAKMQRSPSTTRSIGPNHVINPALYWPAKRVRLISVNMELLVPGIDYKVGWLALRQPLAPKVTFKRTDGVCRWTIDSRAKDMGAKTAYHRSRTRYWLQRVGMGGKFPSPKAYAAKGHTGEFSGDSKDVTWTATTLSPSKPVAVRLLARNDGMTGESALTTGTTHVFAIPNAPTVRKMTVSSKAVSLTVDTNAGYWHPCDELKLQRQVAPRMERGGSWTDVMDIEAGTATISGLRDGEDARIPGEDEATWYRVVSWHDEEANCAYGYYGRAALVGRPKAPTVSAEWDSDAGALSYTVDAQSAMAVRTFVRVKSGSRTVWGPKAVSEGTHSLPVDSSRRYAVEAYNVTTTAAMGDKTATSATARSETVVPEATSTDMAPRLSAVTVTSGPTSGADGTSVTLSWGWDAEDLGGAEYDDLGTLVEWTSASGGWSSTTKPSEYRRTSVERAGSAGEGTVTIDGLEEGRLYYVRLRRYVTSGGDDSYGPETTATCVPESTPGQPVLTAPAAVVAGEDVPLSWTFADEGDSPQVAAHVVMGDGSQHAVDGALQALDVPTSEDAAGTTISARVEVTTGGGWSELRRALLEEEGVPFLPDGRVDMARCRWLPEHTDE
jgi:hypothetical protein